jgi:hypothetical protein
MTTPTPMPRAPSGPQAQGEVEADHEVEDALTALWANEVNSLFENGEEEDLGPGPTHEDKADALPTGRSDEHHAESEGTAVDLDASSLSALGQEEGLEVGDGMGAYAVRRMAPGLYREDQEDAPVSRTEGRKSHRSVCPSCLDDEILRELAPALALPGGAVAEPPAGQTPPPVVSGDDIYLEAHRSRRGSMVTAKQVIKDEQERLVWKTCTYTLLGRPEVALVSTMIALARGWNGRQLRFCLDSAFLPKALIQRDRAIRSPILFARLRELHDLVRQQDVRVELVGPKKPARRGEHPVYF